MSEYHGMLFKKTPTIQQNIDHVFPKQGHSWPVFQTHLMEFLVSWSVASQGGWSSSWDGRGASDNDPSELDLLKGIPGKDKRPTE
ncbi:hypothetical protein E2C01_035353 [Portunus trituberculatus]|uniref:Uncharacterized protein n=1 Tax=Portunus trituberculatus TaxID=210409 RepID=A0A5B7F302_PORTR|nr:hypothetical protein [Portunus trituberculatus]